ncbi:MAG: VTT domain-containing protein [Candidatus Aenigmatarchaeota archaeon]
MEYLGYLSAFVGNMLASSTIVFPIPFFAVYAYLATILNPILLAVISAFGSTLGEFVGYTIGYAGSDLLKKNKYFRFAKRWFKKNGAFTIFLFAATPLPDDVVGLIAGAANYNRSKFFTACLVGKLLLFLTIAFAVRYSFTSLLAFFHLM